MTDSRVHKINEDSYPFSRAQVSHELQILSNCIKTEMDSHGLATAAAQLSLRLLASFAHAHVYADAPRVGRPTTYDGEAGAEMVEYKKG